MKNEYAFGKKGSNAMKVCYITRWDLGKYWDSKGICIEYQDGTDILAQENGYTLEQCLAMDDVKFFLN